MRVRRRRDIHRWSDEDVLANVVSVHSRHRDAPAAASKSYPLPLYRVAIVLHRDPARVPKRLEHLPPYMCFTIQGTPESAGWNSHSDLESALNDAREWVGPNGEEGSFEELSSTVQRVFFSMVRRGASVSEFVFS